MEANTDDFREITSRELLLSLSRLGAALVADRLGLREDELDRDDDDGQQADFEEETEAMEEDGEAGSPFPSIAPRPSSCSFLFPGRSFAGQQRLSGPHRQQEDWAVTATIYSCDFARGRITGSMVAQNSPLAKRPIVTYFEGEVIDNVNNTFWTGCKWGTFPSRDTDLRYWGRCPGFTGGLRAAALQHDGRAPQLGSGQHVFMRWKECFFVDVPQDCPLTITGFYYLSLDRSTGAIGGYYHDARSAPLQVLQLRPVELCGGGSSSFCGGEGGGGGSGRSSLGGLGSSDGSGLAAAGDSGEPPAGMAFGSYSLC